MEICLLSLQVDNIDDGHRIIEPCDMNHVRRNRRQRRCASFARILPDPDNEPGDARRKAEKRAKKTFVTMLILIIWE